MTARNLQDKVKKMGLPWSAAKGFDTFTPVGLSLKINGLLKQDGVTSDMIFRIPRLIEHVSSIMTLEEGDLILTGTPEGVGQVVPGDKVECLLADDTGKELATLNFTAVAREGGYEFQP
ncbi:hypothetical protein C0993_008397 [Termitomyces sp. T159_Od127]|nr:hypothetical protein C0993_008397 [Termitomyces sp. T159_Od127]